MKNKIYKPPLIAEYFLKKFLSLRSIAGALGDMGEMYSEICRKSGRAKAKIWYWKQVLRSIPFYTKNSIYWSAAMFNNYIKIAIRNIRTHKGHSFINITGLAVGVACCLLIYLWVQDETGYDRFHSNADNIYRTYFEEEYAGVTEREWRLPPPLAPALGEKYPEIVNSFRYFNRKNIKITYDRSEYKESVSYVDPSFFDILSFELIKGNKENVLEDIHSILLSERMAEKIFGSDDPLNKTLILRNKHSMTVSGIIKNPGNNSVLKTDIVAPFEFLTEYYNEPGLMSNWGSFGYAAYVQLDNNIYLNDFTAKIKSFFEEQNIGLQNMKLFIQPLSEVYLYSLNGGGPITYVRILSITALFILIIACTNFVNISTALSVKRGKEVGIRKVVGAVRSRLINQFIIESIFYMTAGVTLAVVLTIIVLPEFNSFTGKELTILTLLNPANITAIAVFLLICGILSGLYPAVTAASIKPISIIKKQSPGGGRSYLKDALVILQFSIAGFLFICTFTVSDQIEYMQNKYLGFDKENRLYFSLDTELKGKIEPLKAELKKHSGIESVSAVSVLVGTGTNRSSSGISWEGNTDNRQLHFHIVSVDRDFTETLNMDMVSGRFFSEDHSGDVGKIIINEEAQRQMGLDQAVGTKFQGDTGEIIGVVKDFNLNPLHSDLVPMIIRIQPGIYRHVVVKYSPGNIDETIKFIEKTAKELSPGIMFEYHFVDSEFENMYKLEQKLESIFVYFSFLAIFLSCLGLFGLISIFTDYKMKEIGIRKVLGSPIRSIILTLSKNFLFLVGISNLIFWPISWYFSSKWLETFAFRTEISIFSFILAGLIAFVIAALTLSYRTIKAAYTNPVETLRYE